MSKSSRFLTFFAEPMFRLQFPSVFVYCDAKMCYNIEKELYSEMKKWTLLI